MAQLADGRVLVDATEQQVYMHYTLGLIFAFGYTLTWAATSLVLRSLSKRHDPFLVIGIRGVVGTLVIVPVALLTGWEEFSLLTPTRLAYLIGSVIIGGVLGSTCSVYSLKLLGVGRSFPIANANPLFTYLFSFLLLGERIPRIMLPGTLLVMAGVYLIARTNNDKSSEQPSSHDLFLGVVAALGAAMCWGLNGVILAPGLEGISSVVANSVRVPTVGLLATGIAGLRGQWGSLHHPDRRTVMLFLLVGTLGYALVSTLYVSAVKYAGPSLSAIIGTTAPMFALPLSMLFLHERPTRATLAGTVLTIAGIILVL